MAYDSAAAFQIASQFEIPLQPGRSAAMTDEAFAAFATQYRHWAEHRDHELRQYLASKMTLFRVFLRFSPNVFNLASQLVWYVDEVVTRDPVFRILETEEIDIEQRKQDLRATLQVMAQFRGAIEAGYILLYGSPLLGRLSNDPPAQLIELARSPDVRAAVEQAAYCGYAERPDSQGRAIGIYQIRLESGGAFGFALKNLTLGPGEWTSPTLSPFEVLPRVDPATLKQLAGPDVFERLETTVAIEAQDALASLEAAKRVGAAVVFSDPLKPLLVERAGAEVDQTRQVASVQVLNLAAPYLQDIPPERLQQVRELAPNAFLDFRARLFDLVSSAIRTGPTSDAELRAAVDRQVLPALNSLAAEAQAEVRRGRIVGYGTPIVVALGALLGTSAGLDPSPFLGLAAAAGPLKAAADFAANQAKLQAFPFYFLWRARAGGSGVA